MVAFDSRGQILGYEQVFCEYEALCLYLSHASLLELRVKHLLNFGDFALALSVDHFFLDKKLILVILFLSAHHVDPVQEEVLLLVLSIGLELHVE